MTTPQPPTTRLELSQTRQRMHAAYAERGIMALLPRRKQGIPKVQAGAAGAAKAGPVE